jgi:hypothetical protein
MNNIAQQSQQSTTQDIKNILQEATIVPAQFFGALSIMVLVTSENISRESKTTVHTTEKNASRSDGISVGLTTIRLQCTIGQIKISFKKELLEGASNLSTKVNGVVGLVNNSITGLSTIQERVRNANGSAAQTRSAVQSAGDIYSLYQNWNVLQTQVGRTVQFLRALQDTRTLLSINTSFGFFSNMVLSINLDSPKIYQDWAEGQLVLTEYPQRSPLQYTSIPEGVFQDTFKGYANSTPSKSLTARGVSSDSAILKEISSVVRSKF